MLARMFLRLSAQVTQSRMRVEQVLYLDQTRLGTSENSEIALISPQHIKLKTCVGGKRWALRNSRPRKSWARKGTHPPSAPTSETRNEEASMAEELVRESTGGTCFATPDSKRPDVPQASSGSSSSRGSEDVACFQEEADDNVRGPSRGAIRGRRFATPVAAALRVGRCARESGPLPVQATSEAEPATKSRKEPLSATAT